MLADSTFASSKECRFTGKLHVIVRLSAESGEKRSVFWPGDECYAHQKGQDAASRHTERNRKEMKNAKDSSQDRSAAGPHMMIAKAIADIVHLVQQDRTRNLGDTPVVRQHATNWALSFVERELKLSRFSARLYLGCHQQFGTNPEAIQHLRLTDMCLLFRATDELVSFIVEARKAVPLLSPREVKRLIDAYRGPGNHHAASNA
ncbi:hypothetical protein [Paraburkholderia atlantica]|uniref:hypothetical protein n=1 Tax=Paraburkholderia atlantica TaxID=2654982 RepID=UPI00178E4546|nr:hypothetical protein [Paraburkholderia atlantica]MBB5420636.1 hypothetical protein [Paraburkholderia atlantica]